MEFVKSYEEACARLGRTITLPDVTGKTEIQAKRLIADHKLETILEVNNEGWVAKLGDTNQFKYYPYFDIEEDEETPGGFRLSCHVCSYGIVYASVGARLACKSRELARFMGETFPDLYKDSLS